MKRFNDDAPAGEFTEYTGPARSPSLGADAWTPIVQSLFMGGVAGGVFAGVGALFGAPLWPTWPLCAAVTTVGAYVWRLDVADATLHERRSADSRQVHVQRVDVGAPGHVLVNARGGRQELARANAERGRAEFVQFVRGCEYGPTTARYWEPKIGRPKYTAWRDELLQSGWATREGDAPNAPWHLTATAAEIAAATEAGE